MDTIHELELLREELIQEINSKIGKMIEQLETTDSSTSSPNPAPASRTYEVIYPLNIATGIFKGKRPVGVIFPDNRRIETPTWKSVMEEILKDCCKTPAKKQALKDLRGRVMGRNRVLLGSEPGSMRSPLRIDVALYVETHYDTETLLKILTVRLLDQVGYDYSGIRIAVKAE